MRRRVLALLGTATLLVAGCGLKSYETRLETTLDGMKYQDRLNRLLQPPQAKGKWEELSIYLRPPKNLVQSKAWSLAPTEPGKFDLEASFVEPTKQDMHVLVRVKRAKGTPKKGATNPADTVDRKDFPADVLSVLNESYKPAEELTIAKFKAETRNKNPYKFHSVTANDKTIQIYLYKQEPYDVALVFEYPKSEQKELFEKIRLCLESFAVGEKARRIFSGATEEEATEEATGGGAAPTT